MIKTEDWTFVSSQKDWKLNICERPEWLKTEYLWAARMTENWIFVSGQKDWNLNICEQPGGDAPGGVGSVLQLLHQGRPVLQQAGAQVSF